MSYALEELYQPEVLEKLLEGFARHYPGRKKAAIVSQWSMNYMSVCLPACLIPVIAINQAAPIWRQSTAFIQRNAQPKALQFLEERQPISAQGRHQYYHDLLDNHLGALFPVLAKVGKVNERMLWSNCAVIWDNLFLRVQACPEFIPAAQDAMNWWYKAELVGRKLRLNRFLSLVDSPVPEAREKLPLRSHCCLHYKLHDEIKGEPDVLCESCPKLHRQPLNQQIAYIKYIYETT